MQLVLYIDNQTDANIITLNRSSSFQKSDIVGQEDTNDCIIEWSK